MSTETLPLPPTDVERERRDLELVIDRESDEEDNPQLREAAKKMTTISRSALNTAQDLAIKEFHDEGLERAQRGDLPSAGRRASAPRCRPWAGQPSGRTRMAVGADPAQHVTDPCRKESYR